MKYILEVAFETDSLDPNEGELVEIIRSNVKDAIEVYSETLNPVVKIREV